MRSRTKLAFRLTGVGAAMAFAMAAMSTPASAAIVVTQSAAAAPTYTTTLNFDEPAGPVGVDVPTNAWSGSHGITTFTSGSGSNFVGDNSAATGSGTNSYFGPFGVNINFGSDLTEMSFQGWDNAGPAGPISGGAVISILDNGTEVGSLFITNPAFGGAGNSWFNITTNAGTVFDEVRFFGFAFGFPNSYVDNLSWNVVPEPTSLSLLAFAGVGILARRRRQA